jgi:hypothetical protein
MQDIHFAFDIWANNLSQIFELMDFVLLVLLLVLMASVIVLQIAWRPNRESIETVFPVSSKDVQSLDLVAAHNYN